MEVAIFVLDALMLKALKTVWKDTLVKTTYLICLIAKQGLFDTKTLKRHTTKVIHLVKTYLNDR